MRIWNCSDSVASFVYLCDFGNVPTIWQYLFFYVTLELFQQYGIICFSMVLCNSCDSVSIIWFSIGLWDSSDSVALFVFSIGRWNCSTA